jgi:hypothetical protein
LTLQAAQTAFLRRAMRTAALLLTLVCLSACGNIVVPEEAAPSIDPGYGKTAADHILKTIHNATGTEISQPRWVHAQKGWSWLACIHFQDQGRQRTYVLFIRGNAVIDWRYAVQDDSCDTQTYSPLDLPTGTIRSAAAGDSGPLY